MSDVQIEWGLIFAVFDARFLSMVLSFFCSRLHSAPEPIQGISAAANSSHITVSWPPITDAKWNTVDVTSRSLRICISAPRTLCESLNADDTVSVLRACVHVCMCMIAFVACNLLNDPFICSTTSVSMPTCVGLCVAVDV